MAAQLEEIATQEIQISKILGLHFVGCKLDSSSSSSQESLPQG